jgi:hypothetical protein
MTKRTTRQNPDDVAMKLWLAWEKVHQDPPQILYHYTAAEGLLGMLQSRQMWATNVRFMNDTSELDYGIRLVREIFEEKEFVDQPSANIRTAFRPYREGIFAMLDDAEQNTKHFAVSFCENENLLSQWRGYGQSGGGFALGLETQRLGEFAAEIVPNSSVTSAEIGVFLRRVIYDRNSQQALVQSWVRALVKSLESHRKATKVASDDERLFSSVARLLYECLVCFKHPGFHEEREWRLIQQGRVGNTDVTKVDFRARTGRIVSYTPLTFRPKTAARTVESHDANTLPLAAITYGPTLDPQAAERALRSLLESRGYVPGRVGIRPSGIPFTT